GVNVRDRAAVALMDSHIGGGDIGLGASGKARALLKQSDIEADGIGVDIRDGARVAVIGGTVSALDADGIALSIQGSGSKVAMLGSELAAQGLNGVALDAGAVAKAYFGDTPSLSAQAIGLRADGADTKVIGNASTITAGVAPSAMSTLVLPPEPVAAI